MNVYEQTIIIRGKRKYVNPHAPQKNFCYGGVNRHPSCADVQEQRPQGSEKPRRGQSLSIRSFLCYLNAPQKTVFTSVL